MGISRHYVLAVCLALVAAGLPLAPPHRAAAFDYVTNGGFESGTNGWTAGTQSQFDVARSPDVPPVDGANAARITSSGSSITAIRQTSWSGAPAGRYHVSAWVRITASHTTAVMNITEDPSIDGRQFSSTGPPDHWFNSAVTSISLDQTV